MQKVPKSHFRLSDNLKYGWALLHFTIFGTRTLENMNIHVLLDPNLKLIHGVAISMQICKFSAEILQNQFMYRIYNIYMESIPNVTFLRYDYPHVTQI